MSPPLSTLRDGAKNNTRTQQLQAVRDQASSCLAGLEPLRLEHLPLIKESLTAGEQHAWGYYFPFLLWLSQTKSRSLLWAKMDGSLCLFVENYGIPQHLDLYAPPLPTNGQVLGRCLERANDYNGDLSARIYWIDEKDAAALQEVPGLRLQVKEQEYLYCPHDLRNLSGGAYRTLRHNLRQATENADLEIRPYGPDDSPGCLRLLNDWEHGQGLKYEVLRGGELHPCLFCHGTSVA